MIIINLILKRISFKKVYDYKNLIVFIVKGYFTLVKRSVNRTKAESFLRIAVLFWVEFVNK